MLPAQAGPGLEPRLPSPGRALPRWEALRPALWELCVEVALVLAMLTQRRGRGVGGDVPAHLAAMPPQGVLFSSLSLSLRSR